MADYTTFGSPVDISVAPPSKGQMHVQVPADALKEADTVLVKIQKPRKKEGEVSYHSFTIGNNVNGSSTRWSVNIAENITITDAELLAVLREHDLSPSQPPVDSHWTVRVSDEDASGDGVHVTADLARINWSASRRGDPLILSFVWDKKIACKIRNLNRVGEVLVVDVETKDAAVACRVITEFVTTLIKRHRRPTDPSLSPTKVYLVNAHHPQWYQAGSRPRRPWESIYLDAAVKERIVQGLDSFLESEPLYQRFGVTWKRVYLLHGPPGSGKTSTILGLASRYGYDVAKMTITPTMTATTLEYLFQQLPSKTFLVIEDADALWTTSADEGGKRKAVMHIDFSTMLNCMDGIATRKGLVLFMTTNHKHKLDEAFLRPMRVDECIEFPLPGQAELRAALKDLGADYAHEHEAFLKEHQGDTGMTIAKLQHLLFEAILLKKKSILEQRDAVDAVSPGYKKVTLKLPDGTLQVEELIDDLAMPSEEEEGTI